MNAVAESPGKRTTMTELKPVADQQSQSVVMGFASLQSFELLQRAAKLLASSTLVPKDYQGNLPNCVIALNMAQRIGADPLLVMQNLYVVHGRPGWSAQFLIACFNQCGRFSAIRYKWGGTEGKDEWSCQAYATERDSGEVITGPLITIALAKKEGWYGKNGSKWQTIPQLMLMYRAAAWLVRTHAPEISMGLQTQEELHDVYEAQRLGEGQYAVTTDSLRASLPTTESAEQSAETKTPPDPKAWVESLKNCPAAELDATWQKCLQAFGEDGAPNECDAAYQNRKENIAENAGKQLEL